MLVMQLTLRNHSFHQSQSKAYHVIMADNDVMCTVQRIMHMLVNLNGSLLGLRTLRETLCSLAHVTHKTPAIRSSGDSHTHKG